MKNLINYHIILIKYFAATNHKSAKIKIISKRYNESFTISYDYGNNLQSETAVNHLTNMGFEIIGKGEFGEKETILISNTFKPFNNE